MAKNRKIKMAAAAILNFAISGIFGYCNPCMANIYQCTKFDQNIFIHDRYMAKNRKFKMAAAAILNFAISGIFGYCNPCVVKSISVPNLTKIFSFTTEIWPKMENSRWRPPHVDF